MQGAALSAARERDELLERVARRTLALLMTDRGAGLFKTPVVLNQHALDDPSFRKLTGTPAYRATVFWPDAAEGEERLRPRWSCRVGGPVKPSKSKVYFHRDEPIAGVAWENPGRPVYKQQLKPLSAFAGRIEGWRMAWQDEGVPRHVVESVGGGHEGYIHHVRSAFCLGIHAEPLDMVVCIESLWEHGFADECFTRLDAALVANRTNLLCRMELRVLEDAPRYSMTVPKWDDGGATYADNAAVHAPAKKIFIVHGHNQAVRDKVNLYLKSLGLETEVMSDSAEGGRTLTEKFEEIASQCAFAVFILTADDRFTPVSVATSDPAETNPPTVSRPRQNVLLELGYFWGKLGRRGRLAVLVEDGLDLPSDIKGLSTIELTDLENAKLRLRKELENAQLV